MQTRPQTSAPSSAAPIAASTTLLRSYATSVAKGKEASGRFAAHAIHRLTRSWSGRARRSRKATTFWCLPSTGAAHSGVGVSSRSPIRGVGRRERDSDTMSREYWTDFR